MIVPGSPFLMTSRHFSCATVNLSRETFNWRTLVIKQDWKIMPIVRKSIFDHEKRILIKHSVLLCLLHMRLNITAKINQQSLSLSYSVCMQTSVLFQASSEWTDGTCSLKSHRWQLISVASGASGATGETQFPQSTQVLRCQHHCFASVSEKDLKKWRVNLSAISSTFISQWVWIMSQFLCKGPSSWIVSMPMMTFLLLSGLTINWNRSHI